MNDRKQIKALLIILLLCLSVVSCKKTATVKPLPPAPKVVDTKLPTDIPASQITPNYEIIKKSNQYRKDSGNTYFVIIHPNVLSNDVFKDQIKNLVRKIVKTEEKKENVTIEIFTSLNALDWVASKKSLSAPLLKTRYIAKFVGASSGETYRNTLHIFPTAPEKETLEFDPSKG